MINAEVRNGAGSWVAALEGLKDQPRSGASKGIDAAEKAQETTRGAESERVGIF